MSVMRVAYGADEPNTEARRERFTIGISLAVVAHLAVLGVVMQVRGARAIWEAPPPTITLETYAPPEPPPPRPLERAKPTTRSVDPEPAAGPRTRETPLTPISETGDLIAAPEGAVTPTAGTAPEGKAAVDPPAPSKPDPVIRAADWARRPTASDLERFYPRRAQDLALEGATRLSCTVSADGSAEACKVESETPAGYGFGEASLRMVKSFRFHPMTVDGQPRGGGVIHIPLKWTLPN